MLKRKCLGFALAAILLGAIAGCGGGEESPATASETQSQSPPAKVVDSRPNAATEYTRIHAAMGDRFMDPLINVDTKSALSAAEAAYLTAKQDIVREIIVASKIDRCDFGVDYSQGFTVATPHLRWFRDNVRLLQYDAYRFVQQPSGQAGAADRLVALIRLSKHVGDEPSIVAKLTGIACLGLGTQSIIDWKQRLNQPDSRTKLRTELEAVRRSALLDLRQAFRTEFVLVKHSIDTCNGSIKMMMTDIPISNAEKPELIAELDRIFAAMETVCDSPDAEQQLQTLIDSPRILKAKAFLGGYPSVAKNMRRIRGQLDSAVSAMQ